MLCVLIGSFKMDLVKVKIKGTVMTSQYGTLSDGSILATDAAFAKHLVEDCGAAEYLTAAKTEQKAYASQPASQKQQR